MILSILVSLFTSLVTPVDTSIHTTVEAQAIVSDAGVTPFWMRSLQYGSVPMENPGLILRAWNGKGYNLKKKYDWKYEVEATGWTGKQNDFWLTQAYVSGRRGKWELWAGRRKEVYGLGDTAMTSGFYTWSGNALPMPKVQLGTRDYLNFAKGWLGVHMTYSHGWFDSPTGIKGSMLHQKSLYGRIGKPSSLINIFGGLNHQVQWGGEQKIKTGGEFDYYPSSLNAYFYVVTVLKNRTYISNDPNASLHDRENQYGNHLGSIDLQVKIENEIFSSTLYRQTAYETGRAFALVTVDDGLTGFSLLLKNWAILKSINIEYLNTTNQGQYVSNLGKLLNVKDPHYPEIEGYFNSGRRYPSWSYLNNSLGTPQIILDNQSKQGGDLFYTYNSVNSIYFSTKGEVNKIRWSTRIIYSVHSYPFLPENKHLSQTSGLISLEKNITLNSNLGVSYSFDKGQRINNSQGIMLFYKIKLN